MSLSYQRPKNKEEIYSYFRYAVVVLTLTVFTKTGASNDPSLIEFFFKIT